MYMLKSFVVLLVFLVHIFICVHCVFVCSQQKKNYHLKKTTVLIAVLLTFLLIVNAMLFGEFINPFEQKLDPVLIAQYDVPAEYVLEQPGERFWRGAFTKGINHSSSMWFDAEKGFLQEHYGVYLPPMDFLNHSYIITYGQKIESLSYNVWDMIESPFPTGAKVGHMVLDDTFYPATVFIYQIPKIPIDNDMNLNDAWD